MRASEGRSAAEPAAEWKELGRERRPAGTKACSFVRLKSISIGGDFDYVGREDIDVFLETGGKRYLPRVRPAHDKLKAAVKAAR